MSNPGRDPHIKVLMYHRVVEHTPDKDSNWHYVSATQFKRQMRLIDKMGFTTITFIDYQLYLQGELSLPARPIIITFDDGYLDTYEHAVPILRELGMKAVVFVMGNRKLRQAAWDETGENDHCPLMTNAQLRTLRLYGFEIGAHSMNHSNLVELTNRDVFREVDTSKRQIESVLRQPVYTFAYPYGSVDERVQKIVELAGYSFACGVYTGSPDFGKTELDIRRIAINQKHSLIDFVLRLVTPYEHLEWLYHRIKSFGWYSVKTSLQIHKRANQADQ